MLTDKLPNTLICDGAGAAALKRLKVDAVVVGADRVVANGDTANKIGVFELYSSFSSISYVCVCRNLVNKSPTDILIHVSGTYHLAVACAFHNVPFFVAAPVTSIDCSLPNGIYAVVFGVLCCVELCTLLCMQCNAHACICMCV